MGAVFANFGEPICTSVKNPAQLPSRAECPDFCAPALDSRGIQRPPRSSDFRCSPTRGQKGPFNWGAMTSETFHAFALSLPAVEAHPILDSVEFRVGNRTFA